MAKCAFCGREMLKAKGCRKITIRFVDGSRADPIKVGAPGDFYGCLLLLRYICKCISDKQGTSADRLVG